ncbi:hypothetical protein BDK51DRAFT_30375 [Blyttiomyces helicus]|uniref:Uncharacterized protein n=1 Tax=Blyttiomyces helicus TaxID=388810 RepID=A0A4P9WKX9_9FUNG|nr:hypothetical protein BDK51DRAFT_30375 [Blyttiomyces helicus]|eukprot:RKO91840.1 hypothetical protein BDK51DRAFT_30375 [Blyttiomyces helicus]
MTTEGGLPWIHAVFAIMGDVGWHRRVPHKLAPKKFRRSFRWGMAAGVRSFLIPSFQMIQQRRSLKAEYPHPGTENRRTGPTSMEEVSTLQLLLFYTERGYGLRDSGSIRELDGEALAGGGRAPYVAVGSRAPSSSSTLRLSLIRPHPILHSATAPSICPRQSSGIQSGRRKAIAIVLNFGFGIRGLNLAHGGRTNPTSVQPIFSVAVPASAVLAAPTATALPEQTRVLTRAPHIPLRQIGQGHSSFESRRKSLMDTKFTKKCYIEITEE